MKLLAMLRWVRPYQIVIPELFRESRNKKSARIAIFLRLRIVSGFQIAHRGAKVQVIGRVKVLFCFAGTERSP